MSGQLHRSNRVTRFRYDRLPSAAEKKALLDFTKLMTAAKAKGYVAPFKAIEALEKGLNYDLDTDLTMEAGLFADCLLSDVAQNLIAIFLNTRSAGRLPRIENLTPAKIKKVALLGGGVMGSGIVHLLLTGGFQAVLWDINATAVQKGVATLRGTFDYHIKNKKMSAAELDSDAGEAVGHHHLPGGYPGCRPGHRGRARGHGGQAEPVEKTRRNMPAGGDLCYQHLRAAHHRNGGRPERPGAHDRAALLQPGPAHAASGDHLRAEDIRSNPGGERRFCPQGQEVPIVVHDGPGFYVSRQLWA